MEHHALKDILWQYSA